MSAAISKSKPIPCLGKSTTEIVINGVKVNALIDSGSSDSFIHPAIVEKLKLSVKGSKCTEVSMASGSLKSTVTGYVDVNFEIAKNYYTDVKLNVMDNLCLDVILGLDF